MKRIVTVIRREGRQVYGCWATNDQWALTIYSNGTSNRTGTGTANRRLNLRTSSTHAVAPSSRLLWP